MRRKFLTAIFFLAACSKPASDETREARYAHPGRAGGRMDFSPPKDAPNEHWCADDGTCHRTEKACVPGPCVKHERVHCFDMIAHGTLYEVCHTTERACQEHRRSQTEDASVDSITDGCQPR
jgi:hypothetical protein